MKLGTRWVAPGEGSTVGQLVDAFDVPAGFTPFRLRTNLELTGEPIQASDRDRLHAVNAEDHSQPFSTC